MWIEKFIHYLRHERNYSPRTEISYFRDLTQFKEFVTGRQAGELTRQEESLHPGEIDQRLIRQWLATLMEEDAATVNRKLSAVKSFYFTCRKVPLSTTWQKVFLVPRPQRLPT